MSNSASTRNKGQRPTIAITPGEPAGIGPDLALTLADRAAPARLVFIADPALLSARAALLGHAFPYIDYDPAREPPPGSSEVLRRPLAAPVTPGELSTANARYVLDCLDCAAQGCLDGRFDAMVTGPVHKGIVNDAGIPFTGHTEYLAARARAEPVMMLAADRLRVALVTTHLALRAVPDAITREAVRYTLETVQRELNGKFGIEAPRIAVCGLNPHAGEGGHLGREEIEIIAPVIADCIAAGIDARGPLPADTVFTPSVLDGVDAVVAMYHDQGLTALKALGFGRAINITLGLPFIRTSVDHGTALDLAGTGRASAESFEAALALAVELAALRRARSA
ncbi:MAG TPA: 4-hydroxythreonine-4-phosphate dehydrogenase PdxA [Gammaproteobacteria bacterium]|nr:4-hydroxythreonine-4-phosphate dehydrogenase PdxA [Gammaproteobacteria bacterium]